jgi:hypothetical protein
MYIHRAHTMLSASRAAARWIETPLTEFFLFSGAEGKWLFALHTK